MRNSVLPFGGAFSVALSILALGCGSADKDGAPLGGGPGTGGMNPGPSQSGGASSSGGAPSAVGGSGGTGGALGGAGSGGQGGTESQGGAPPAGGAGGGSGGAPEPPLGTPYVFISGYGTTITRFTLDPEMGKLSDPKVLSPGVSSPSYLAVSPDKRRLFALNKGAGPASVISFALSTSDPILTKLGEAPAGGDGPAHVAVHPAGELLFVANYSSGDVASIRIPADGRIAGPVLDSDNPGKTSHQVVFDKSGRYFFVPSVNGNTVHQYKLDAATGQFESNGNLTGMPPGAGPRHIAFHPTEKWAYTINELGQTVSTLDYDAATGTLSNPTTVNSLPDGVNMPGTGAHIVVHPSGKFVYASNRGHDSVTLFTIDQATGRASFSANENAAGEIVVPRDFDVDPTGRVLIVGSSDALKAHVFKLNPENGSMQLTDAVDLGEKAAFLGIVYLQ